MVRENAKMANVMKNKIKYARMNPTNVFMNSARNARKVFFPFSPKGVVKKPEITDMSTVK